MKTKFASRRRAIILAAAVIMAAALSQAYGQDGKPFLGSWRGKLDAGGQEIEIRLVFSLDETKKIKGTFDSITRGTTGIKLGKIDIDGRNISFAIEDPRVPLNFVFRGKLDASGRKIIGDYTASGLAGTFSVEREAPQK